MKRTSRHQSITDRIRLLSRETGVDAQRIRRSLVFQRVLARVAPHGVVLKGGYCLEARLGTVARTTKDLDLVGAMAGTSDPDDVLDAVLEMLDAPRLGDGFGFTGRPPTRMRADDSPHPAWRIRLISSVDGAAFETVTLDLVSQLTEVEGGVERLRVSPPLTLADIEAVEVLAVDVYQHAAEKLHAISRLYAGDRPSTRVKDLVDLVLLCDSGLLPDRARLRDRMTAVWAERDQTSPPSQLPHPPTAWTSDFRRYAADLQLRIHSAEEAFDMISQLHTAATKGTTP